jgi:hypothetical protein
MQQGSKIIKQGKVIAMGKYEETFRSRRIKMDRIKKRINEWYDSQQIENYNNINNQHKLQNKLASFLFPWLRRKPN